MIAGLHLLFLRMCAYDLFKEAVLLPKDHAMFLSFVQKFSERKCTAIFMPQYTCHKVMMEDSFSDAQFRQKRCLDSFGRMYRRLSGSSSSLSVHPYSNTVISSTSTSSLQDNWLLQLEYNISSRGHQQCFDEVL